MGFNSGFKGLNLVNPKKCDRDARQRSSLDLSPKFINSLSHEVSHNVVKLFSMRLL